MTRMGQTQEIILNLLSDGEIHSINEFRKEIEKNPDLLTSDSNFIYVVLNNLKSKKRLINSVGTGLYQIADHTFYSEPSSKMFAYRAKVLKTWSAFYKKNIANFEISLDMSEEDFHNAKWLYELNKKMEDLINNFDSDTN